MISNHTRIQATKELPAGYQEVYQLDLTRNIAVAIWLNLAALWCLILFSIWFTRLAIIWQPGVFTFSVSVISVLYVLLSISLMLVLHEGTHGVFFWLTTGERPHFGFNLLYAYAFAPQWYIPRNVYIIIGLAPAVLLTAIGLTLMPFLPHTVWLYLLIFLAMNASGSIGDILVVALLCSLSGNILINDLGDRFILYEQMEEE